MSKPSKITTDLAVDDPVRLTAGLSTFGNAERRFLDNQVIGMETHLVNLLIKNRLGTFAKTTGIALDAGDVVCLHPSSSSEAIVTKMTTAAAANAIGAFGIAVTSVPANSYGAFLIGGAVGPDITGLPTGTAGFAIVDATGRLAFSSSPGSTDIVVGSVNTSGWLKIDPSAMPGGGGGGGSATVSDDIAKHAGVDIDRVRGVRGVPIAGSDGDVPEIGGSLHYNTQGSPSYKIGNPSPHGWANIEDFGAVPSTIGSGANDCTQAIKDAIAYLTTNTSLTHHSRVVYIPPAPVGKEWYVAGATSDMYPMRHIEVPRSIVFQGAGGGRMPAGGSVVKCGPLFGGFRVTGNGFSVDGGDGTGTVFRGIRFMGTPIDSLPVGDTIVRGWLAGHPYALGDKIQPHRYHGMYFECIKGGTSNGSTPAIGVCSRYATTSYPVAGNRWRPGKTYAVNDQIYPNWQCGWIFKCSVGGTTVGDVYGAGPQAGEAVWEIDTSGTKRNNCGEPDWFNDFDDPSGTAYATVAEIEGPTWVKDVADPEPIWEVVSQGLPCLASSYQTNHSYFNGAWVFATGRFDVIFVASTPDLRAPETSGSSEPAGFAGAVIGGSVSDGNITWHCIAPVGIVTDGTAVWAARTASGVVVNQETHVDNCYFADHPNGGYFMFSYVVPGSVSAIPDFSTVAQCTFNGNGIGVHVKGGDANACTFRELLLFGQLGGWLDPADHAIYDHGFLGNHYYSCTIQGCSGFPFGIVGPAASGTIHGSYIEGAGRKAHLGGSTSFYGGTVTANQFRLRERDANSSFSGGGFVCVSDTIQIGENTKHPEGVAGLNVIHSHGTDRASVFHFRSNNIETGLGGDTGGYNLLYNSFGTGYWGFQSSSPGSLGIWALLLSGESSDIGPGHCRFVRGYYIGQDFPHYHFSDISNIRSEKLTLVGGLRQGDIVDRSDRAEVGRYYYDVNVNTTTSDYGHPWQASTTYAVGDIIVPTTANMTVNRRAFQATSIGSTPHHSGGSEPSWNDTLAGTTSDGDITWTTIQGADLRLAGLIEDGFVGRSIQTTVAWKDSADTDSNAAAAKSYVKGRRRQVQTTTNTASQVVDDGIYNGVAKNDDFTLPTDAITIVDATLLVKLNGSADGGSIRMSGTFYRNGSGAPVRVGTDDNTAKLSAGVAGVTAALVINGNAVEVQVSPGSTITLDWRLTRVQYAGAS